MIDMVDDEALIKGLMENYPEASAGNCLKCIQYDYKRMLFVFHDEETGKRHPVNMENLQKGFKVLLNLALTGRYNNFQNAALYDGGSWDSIDIDALVQCTVFGKVIYG